MPSNGEQQPPRKGDQEPSGGSGADSPSQGQRGTSRRPPTPPPGQSSENPSGRPEYPVYRSRRGLLSRLRSTDVSGLRERARRSYRRLGRGGQKAEDQPGTAPKPLVKQAL